MQIKVPMIYLILDSTSNISIYERINKPNDDMSLEVKNLKTIIIERIKRNNSI